MKELKPCPFCGGEAAFICNTRTIKCKRCGGAFFCTNPSRSFFEVAQAWNHRAENEKRKSVEGEMKMTDRERLIKLKINFVENFDCGDCEPSNDKCRKCLSEKEADYLIEHGVVVLPCKVGDYVEYDNGICLSLKQVRGFLYFEDGLRYILEDCEPFVTHSNIKRIVPREQAEQALKEKEEEKK